MSDDGRKPIKLIVLRTREATDEELNAWRGEIADDVISFLMDIGGFDSMLDEIRPHLRESIVDILVKRGV